MREYKTKSFLSFYFEKVGIDFLDGLQLYFENTLF